MKARFANKFWVLAGPITLIECLLLFFHLRNDPEPYHSGLIYAQSIAANEGLLPNRDFLSPYGITGPLLNGALLEFTDKSLLSLLLLYGCLTVITGIVLYQSTAARLGRWNAFALNLVWAMTFVTTLPWPSLLTTLLTLLSFNLIIHSNLSTSQITVKIKIRLFLAALLMQLSILTRIHLAVSLLLVTLVFVFRAEKSIFLAWSKFNLLIAGIIITLMIRADVLGSYIEQVIVWPLTDFTKPPMTLGLYFSFIWFPLLSLIALFLFSVVLAALEIRSQHQKYALVCLILTLCALCIYGLSNVNTSAAPPTIRSWLGFTSVFKSNFQVLIGFVSSFLFVILGARFLIMRNRKPIAPLNLRENSISKLLSLCMGMTALVQLFPLHDNVHIWFVTPLLIFAVVELVEKHFFSSRNKVALLLVSSILILNQFSFLAKNLQIDRIPLVSRELTGMYGTPDFAQVVDRTMLEIDKLDQSRVLRNNCTSALYSISNRNYISIDGNFLGNFFEAFTNYVPVVNPSSKKPEFIFYCNSNLREQEILKKQNYGVQFTIPTQLTDNLGNGLFNVLYYKK
jgi:hypothetical protein